MWQTKLHISTGQLDFFDNVASTWAMTDFFYHQNSSRRLRTPISLSVRPSRKGEFFSGEFEERGDVSSFLASCSSSPELYSRLCRRTWHRLCFSFTFINSTNLSFYSFLLLVSHHAFPRPPTGPLNLFLSLFIFHHHHYFALSNTVK